MHHFVSHIVVAFTWSFAFVLPHPNAWIIVIYCGVIFFPLFSFSVGSLSLLHCILFDFGTFLFHSTAQVKWSKPKNMTGTRYGTGQIDKVNEKKNWLNFVAAFRCWTRKTKNFFMRRTRETAFSFLWGRFPSNYTYYFFFLLLFFLFSFLFRKCYYMRW